MSLGRLVRGQARGLPADRDRGRCESLSVCVCACVGSCAFQQTSTANCGEAHLRASPAPPTRDDSNIPPYTTPPPPPAHTLHLPSCHPVNSPTTALSLAREKKPHQSLLPTSQPPSQPASSACKLGPTIALACPCARSLLPPAPTVTSLAPYHNIALPCRAFPARHSKRGRLSATATWLPSPLACPPLALAPRRIS